MMMGPCRLSECPSSAGTLSAFINSKGEPPKIVSFILNPSLFLERWVWRFDYHFECPLSIGAILAHVNSKSRTNPTALDLGFDVHTTGQLGIEEEGLNYN
jgi:hypothetical protein